MECIYKNKIGGDERLNNGLNYFKDTDAYIVGNSHLRNIQRIAHRKLIESFKSGRETHKMIVLPTGSGKTGVIALSPFGISEGRVLVITPSLIIREGISDDFDTRTIFNFWTKRNVILDDEKLPSVYRYAGFNTNSDKKRVLKYLNNANIVIANIHKVYNNGSNRTLMDILNTDFFDMIIIDEAHHSAADSWLETLDYFDAKKVIKLTATPYRADEKDLDGEIVYSYSLGSAIKDGLVKNLVAEDYTVEKLEFEIDGKVVNKEEAISIMDRNWVSRSVAYSDNCSSTIVDMSIKRLKEKRRLGNCHHQIIAVACSIDHAERIKKLYEERGLRAEYVSSDRIDESAKAIIEYKKGIIDVLVNVNMLGEGFDHSNISIAAIFRPFRSLSPYAQFIGRSLRVIQDSEPINEIDNIAHVIYHKDLELDDLWEYYTEQKTRSERIKLIESEYERDEFENRSRDVGEVSQSGDMVSSVKTFLGDNVDSRYRDSINQIIVDREKELTETVDKLKLSGISDEDIEEFKKGKRRKLDEDITKKRNKLREELIREELHELHINEIVDRVNELYESTKIDPKGNELVESTRNAYLKSGKTNDGYIMKYINFNLKSKLKRGIDEWETYDFEMARNIVPQLIERIKEKIERIGEDNE